MRKNLILISAVLALSTVPGMAASTKQSDSSTKLGMLDCVIEGGMGLILGSNKDVTCTFTPGNDTMPPEAYVGSIKKFGLDVGGTEKSVMKWLVFAPTEKEYALGALAGDYTGVGAEATVVVGAGANVLVGGSNKTFTLQPLSLQAQTGLNVAAGVTSFELRVPQ
jgi:Protein of unknown function (DUF992)